MIVYLCRLYHAHDPDEVMWWMVETIRLSCQGVWLIFLNFLRMDSPLPKYLNLKLQEGTQISVADSYWVTKILAFPPDKCRWNQGERFFVV